MGQFESPLPPRTQQWHRSGVLAALIGCIATPLGTAGFAAWYYGSAAAAIAAVNGHSLLPDSDAKPLGDVEVNKATSVSFRLRNLTGHPIRIQGAQVSCSCSAVEGLPRSIGPGGETTITATVMAGSIPDRLEGSFALFTDDADEPEIRLRYSGRIVPARSGVVP